MGQRSIRVNELVKRELSSILHTDYRDVSVRITVSRVEVAPDLRVGYVYYSVIGDEVVEREAEQLFQRIGSQLQRKVFRKVILKYTPQLRFIHDPSLREGDAVIQLLDELDTGEPLEDGDEDASDNRSSS